MNNIPVFSIVTISFNQARFLKRTIDSVLAQEGVDIEYIIVDAGSTDGSREIITAYKDRISKIVFENDRGAADGLNKGFSYATGDIYCYLNSDDTLNTGALRAALDAFENRRNVDVICGHAWVIDEHDKRIRRVWSDPYNFQAAAFGYSIQIQPSTFFRADAFRRVGGFNPENKSNWDGELMLDFAKAGLNISLLNSFMSNYRLHSSSITASGSEDRRISAWHTYRFRSIMGRDRSQFDRYRGIYWFLYRQFRNPAAFIERLLRGPIYKRFEK